MKTLLVKTGTPYEIKIERGLLRRAGDEIRRIPELRGARKAAVVTDSNLATQAQAVKASLKAAGYDVTLHVFPAGEESKNLSSIAAMLEAFAQFGLTRTDFAVAFGGGVTGDMAGFAAASYLRGIPFVQIPTSLLAQVDSSVGGKTGVDLPQGKNLVGAFWQPRLVLIDPDTLNTLPPRYFADGMGEVVKYGCIRNRALFDSLRDGQAWERLEDIIYQCVDIKRQVVENDERDKGERMILNFGHTLGHSLEKAYHFQGPSHGEAVGVGMVRIVRASEAAGFTARGTADEIVSVLQAYGLPVSDPISDQILAAGAVNDKKSLNGKLNLVLLKEIGRCAVVPISQADLLPLLEGRLSL